MKCSCTFLDKNSRMSDIHSSSNRNSLQYITSNAVHQTLQSLDNGIESLSSSSSPYKTRSTSSSGTRDNSKSHLSTYFSQLGDSTPNKKPNNNVTSFAKLSKSKELLNSEKLPEEDLSVEG